MLWKLCFTKKREKFVESNFRHFVLAGADNSSQSCSILIKWREFTLSVDRLAYQALGCLPLPEVLCKSPINVRYLLPLVSQLIWLLDLWIFNKQTKDFRSLGRAPGAVLVIGSTGKPCARSGNMLASFSAPMPTGYPSDLLYNVNAPDFSRTS